MSILTDSAPKFTVTTKQDLRSILDADGITFHDVEGVYDGITEQSIMIADFVSKDYVAKLGEIFGQESVVWFDHDNSQYQLVYTNGDSKGTYYKSTHVEFPTERPADYYTKLGHRFMQITFDFDNAFKETV
jgi:hypothetical protein